MAVDTAEVRANTVDDDDARRPLMTAGNIAWMNLGFFGVQFSFGLTQSAYFLGNSFGPMTGGVVGAAFGLHWVFLVTAMLLGGAAVAVWMYVRDRMGADG